MNRTIISTALLAIALSGCTNIAAIHKKNGDVIRTRIKSSDRTAVFVARPGESTKRISRSEIESITHPGTYTMSLGGSLTVAGLFFFLVPFIWDLPTEGPYEFPFIRWWVGSALAISTGIPLLSFGWHSHASSVERATYKYEVRSSITPIMLRDENNQRRVGLGWQLKF